MCSLTACVNLPANIQAVPEATVPDKTKAALAQAVPKGTIYTCPIHPQIRQVGPGNCPICGMTLEPVKATAEVGENRELIDMTQRPDSLSPY
jgi:Cu+-exporting ATPase